MGGLMPRRKRKGPPSWTPLYQAGARGHTVSVGRIPRSRFLYLRWWRADVQDYGYRSCRHEDLELAQEAAHQLAEEIRKKKAGRTFVRPTPAALLSRYEAERTPQVGVRRREEHTRFLDLWQRQLAGVELEDVPAAVADYETRRLEDVGPRTVEAEVRFLMAVTRWASSPRPRGGRILDVNPLAHHTPPREPTPRRPYSSFRHWLRTYRYADRVDPQRFLRLLLLLVHVYGWRVSALCQLRASDVDLRPRDKAPHGRILKRGESDKMGVERWVPLTARARRALLRHLRRRQVVGDVWLFPAPRAKGKPWSRWHARNLHRAAQELAGLELLGWHAHRRKWATERKHLSRVDTAFAAGYLSPRMLDVYAQPEDDAVLGVLEATETRSNLRSVPEKSASGRRRQAVVGEGDRQG